MNILCIIFFLVAVLVAALAFFGVTFGAKEHAWALPVACIGAGLLVMSLPPRSA